MHKLTNPIKMKTKMFSIITVNYNNKDGLQKTIESVISQEFKNFEFIIIDGGSTDGSVEIIKKYEKHITYWVSEPDNGIYHAMNKGIQQAQGEYLNFMNSGDCLYNEQTLRLVNEKHNNKDIILGWRKTDKGVINTFSPQITALSLFEGGLFHQAAFIKRTLSIKYPYNENRKIVSDWQFFFKTIILDNSTYVVIERPLCIYDTTGISCTDTQAAFLEKGELLKEMLPEKIYVDYLRFLRINSPIINLIPEIYKYKNIHHFIYRTDAFIIKVHKILRKLLRK